MRQLTYFIPLDDATEDTASIIIERAIMYRAVALSGNCSVRYEEMHDMSCVPRKLMVFALLVDPLHVDRVHVKMQIAIAKALAVYSPNTDAVQVTEGPILARDFNPKELINGPC